MISFSPAPRKIALLTFLGIAFAASGRAQTITEDFSADTLPSSLRVFHGSGGEGGSEILLEDGMVYFSGLDRTYLATNFSSYYNTGVVAELSVRLGNDSILFFGLGASNMLMNGAQEPGWEDGTALGLRLHDASLDNIIAIADNGPGPRLADGAGANMSASFARARMVWDGNTHTAVFSVDIDYDGTFIADFTSDAINGADNGFVEGDAFLYFGSNNFSLADDFSVTTVSAIPEPSTYALLAGVMTLGLALLRRRTLSLR